MGYYLVYLCISFFFSWFLLSPFHYFGKKYECFPENTKYLPSDRKRKPYLGGGPLYFGFILSLLTFFFWKVGELDIAASLTTNKLPGILIGAAILAFLGLIHDVSSLSPLFRIVGQILATVTIILFGIHTELHILNVIPITISTKTFYLGNVVVSFIWIISLINIFDSLELFDGLIVSIGTIISLFLATIAIMGNDYFNGFMGVVTAGILLGVMFDQMKPPKILLGKMGSSFIGLLLATISINITYTRNNNFGAFIPIILMFVPVVTLLAAILRKKTGKSEYFSIQEIYYSLKHSGIQMSKVLNTSLLLSLLTGVIALILFFVTSKFLSLLMLLLSAIIYFIILIKLTTLESADL